jgi:hypothetical protein
MKTDEDRENNPTNFYSKKTPLEEVAERRILDGFLFRVFDDKKAIKYDLLMTSS